MMVREDKASRTLSIELAAGERNYATLLAKGTDSRVVDFIAERFEAWVRDELDVLVGQKVAELEKGDEDASART